MPERIFKGWIFANDKKRTDDEYIHMSIDKQIKLIF